MQFRISSRPGHLTVSVRAASRSLSHSHYILSRVSRFGGTQLRQITTPAVVVEEEVA